MEDILQLSHKEFLKIHSDPEKAAKAADLVYVTNASEG